MQGIDCPAGGRGIFTEKDYGAGCFIVADVRVKTEGVGRISP